MICNAGRVDKEANKGMAGVELDTFRKIMDVNFMCPVAMTKEALPQLQKNKGSILYTSSVLGK